MNDKHHHHAIRSRVDRRRGGRGHRPLTQARGRDRRGIGDRRRDHPRAGRAGAQVTIAVRDTEARERVPADIDGDVRVAPLELTDLGSLKSFLDAWDGPLDVLVNNAGVMAIQELELTPAGLERQFATNHVGHFAASLTAPSSGWFANSASRYSTNRPLSDAVPDEPDAREG